ncbi:glycosyltransferase [Streptomyces sp. M19]
MNSSSATSAGSRREARPPAGVRERAARRARGRRRRRADGSALRQALPGARFLGRRTGDELARVLASFDVFAHTGPQETFCQTVQEAQAAGVAVIAPAVGGPLDLVAHGRTGLLVPPDDADAVRDAVALLAADPGCGCGSAPPGGTPSRAAPGRPSATS